jgi:hypothetical protein
MDNVYLGKSVPDVRRPGLDSPIEVKRICAKILDDYHSRRISYKKAMSRLNLLELIVQRSGNFSAEEKARLRSSVDDARRRLADERYKLGRR